MGIGTGAGPGRSVGGWRNMSTEALEEQYSPSRWSPRMGSDAVIQAHLAATAAGTQRARAGTETSLHIPYGGGEGEKLDIYLPRDTSGTFPLLVYIHGGYWQCLSKEESGFAAPPLVSQGVMVAAVGYDTAPKGRCCSAEALAAGAGPAPTRLCPLSSQATWTSWCCRCGAASPSWWSTTVGSGAVLVSGVYDLEPILHTYVNDALKMSREVAQRNSPMLCVTPPAPMAAACEVLVAVAQHDSPEFRRQSQEYGQAGWRSGSILPAPHSPQALRTAGWSVSLMDLAGVDHFDIIEKLSEESYVLTQVILNMISRA
ncbi:kynurenine formamidase isoform X2 [Cuculus canorus]|uniref:kynurenine formamidase isoform X2 n=1 Tax=Cuculus canorus TaxID=55661 RepID=UPI0023AAAFCC|nr:kynurenine formamidase isoform X2 [Cuculus canorus]